MPSAAVSAPAPAAGRGSDASRPGDRRPDDRHPAPHRDQVSRRALWAGIFGGPLCWGVQVVLGYGYIAHTCYPEAVPHHRPIFAGAHGAAVGLSALALAGTLGAGLVALRSWRATHDEKGGQAAHLLHNAEGRTRFMAMAGLIMSGLFLLGVLITAMPLVVGRVCPW